MSEPVLKFVPGDEYFIQSSQGYTIARNQVKTEIKFSVYKGDTMLGVANNYRAALLLCVQHDGNSCSSIEDIDQSEVPKEFKNSVVT